jgi:pimeloyl-ACP methyl ester carboxylesterase
MAGIKTLENLENSGAVQNTIVIIPAINVAPGQDTECLNLVGGPQVETWITSDMHEFATRFIGIDNRKWSTFGYSTGGWCAAEAAILHPDLYSSAVSLAGYFKPTFSFGVPKSKKAYYANQYNLVSALQKHPTSVKVMIIASQKDKFTNAAAHDFIGAASSLIPIRYVPIPSGGHNTSVWKPFVSTAFQWINQNNPPQTPISPSQP